MYDRDHNGKLDRAELEGLIEHCDALTGKEHDPMDIAKTIGEALSAVQESGHMDINEFVRWARVSDRIPVLALFRNIVHVVFPSGRVGSGGGEHALTLDS
eukprot:TRINITY_DN4890_c0_g1_i4.p2 TRINITY_DN4890_c0_g1~~TRINITY_DN4890_c0_g1_i4.p2  ORF type:complete len:100 (+),score=26.53 TRINITY_DN4890_c0_g1_i4:438-737(+)